MNFYSYAPGRGMEYHPTKDVAKTTAELAIKQLINAGSTDAEIDCITWGEVTERAASTGEVGYALKRQDRLSYEAEFPQVIDGRMENGNGDLVLLKNISAQDLLEHDMVLSIAVIWEQVSSKVARFKQYCFEDVTTFVDLLFEKYNAKRGGTEGNMTFTTQDRRWKLVIAIQKTIAFGPEIEVAKQKMLEAAREMSNGSALEAMVVSLLTQVDGQLRVAEVLRLCNQEIPNDTWNEAVAIVRSALEVISKKKQIRLYQRSEQGQYIPVPLNIAAL